MNADEAPLPPALGHLGHGHRLRLAELSTPVRFTAGEFVFRENEPATRCWLLGTGSVVLTTLVPGRGTVALETLHGGDVLGWSWLGTRQLWQFDAQATTTTDAAEVDVAALEQMALSQPDFGYAVTRALSGVLIARLQSTRARLLDLYANRGER
ncbi:cyclic nucleotide-binding domain-containing protein [Rhodococcus sp. WB9]|uniref:cyclic nucleotide-binding domain-containing protein n=1 Tax=Rhodococcus sp. WB9 TaxID=2594007 RepID=UPI0011857C66|nr:cyclic nucleotide-binding domain-containing protein [Rhodococcus sp. WB9]QDQ92619.1 cyclic nucleotide-binding domain-containing protein [Rhodococcus sp. WB9]